jgi:hypothetical protein
MPRDRGLREFRRNIDVKEALSRPAAVPILSNACAAGRGRRRSAHVRLAADFQALRISQGRRQESDHASNMEPARIKSSRSSPAEQVSG